MRGTVKEISRIQVPYFYNLQHVNQSTIADTLLNVNLLKCDLNFTISDTHQVHAS